MKSGGGDVSRSPRLPSASSTMMAPSAHFNMNAPKGREHAGQAPSTYYSFQTDHSPIPWAEVCCHCLVSPVAWDAEPTPEHADPQALLPHWQTNQLTPTSLWQIFSRHEAVLNTHLDLLGSVKGHVAPDGEVFRAVSSMVNKTIQAMNQFKIVRKHMVCSCAELVPCGNATDTTCLLVEQYVVYSTSKTTYTPDESGERAE